MFNDTELLNQHFSCVKELLASNAKKRTEVSAKAQKTTSPPYVN